MAGEVVKLKELKKEDVPADLRAETYFDFKAHAFAHQALFDKTASVYGAILGINEYASKWLADAIAQKKGGAKVLKNETPKPARATGNFEVVIEEGATFEPDRVYGSAKQGVCHAIFVEKGAKITGGDFYVDKGSVYIGSGTSVEPGVGIKGPCIIGPDNEVRQGTYFRGNVITGAGGTFRGEIKNAVLMDDGNFPHPSYIGDSLCGWNPSDW